MLDHHGPRHSGGGDDAQSGREPIQAVNQVEGIHESDTPENGKDAIHRPREGIIEEESQMDASDIKSQGGDDLTAQFYSGLESPAVIRDADKNEKG